MTPTAPAAFVVDPEFADAVIKWAPTALIPRGIVAIALGVPGNYVLHWGDGSSTAGTGAALRHTYAAPGAYTVTAKQDNTVVATAQVFIRDGLEPAFTLAIAADNQQIVELTINADPADIVSTYAITWGAGGPVETVVAAKGTVRSHGFEAGTHAITVRDLRTGRVVTKEIAVTEPTYDPDFSVAKGPDVNTALLTLTAVSAAKDVLVDWGDGTQDTLPAAKVDDKKTHTYAAADTYIIQVVFADGSTDGSARTVTIPFPVRDGKGIGRP